MVKHAYLLVTTGEHYANTYNGECTMIKLCFGTNSFREHYICHLSEWHDHSEALQHVFKHQDIPSQLTWIFCGITIEFIKHVSFGKLSQRHCSHCNITNRWGGAYSRNSYMGVWSVWCLITSGISTDTQCHVWSCSFLSMQRPDQTSGHKQSKL